MILEMLIDMDAKCQVNKVLNKKVIKLLGL